MNVHSPGETYAQAALDRECETLARTSAGRNDQLNRSAFNIGQLVGSGGLDRPSAETKLLEAARANGYVAKDGEAAARTTIRSGLERGMEQPRGEPSPSQRTTGLRQATREPISPQAVVAANHDVPDWTRPDAKKGQPKFFGIGSEEPPPLRGEERRHAYRRDTRTVRVKVKLSDGSFLDFYLVRRPSDGAIGWQARKPKDYVLVPYIGQADALDPFDPEHVDDPVFSPEGEKDVDTLQKAGALAFTFGGGSDVPRAFEDLVHGRHVVLLGDNDEPGRRCVARKAALAVPVAASVRQVGFEELDDGQDVSDWFAERGGTIEDLLERAKPVAALRPPKESDDPLLGFQFDGDAPIEPPRYAVKRMLPAEGVAIIGGQSGAGKTFAGVELAVCLATGRPFFGHRVVEVVGTLILAAEGAGTIAGRIEAARKSRADGKTLPISWVAIVPNLADVEEIKALQPKIRAVDARFRKHFGVRLGVIIIDTLAAAFAMKDENDAAEAQGILRNCRMLGDPIGALVAPIHHYGKTEETGLRGSSAYRGGSDVVLSILAERNQVTGEVGSRSLNLAKSRFDAEGPISGFSLRYVPLGLDYDGEEFGTCVVEPALGEPLPSAVRRVKKDSLPVVALKGAFDEMLGSHGRETPVMGDGPIVRAITVNDLRDEFRRRYVTGEVDEEKAKTNARQGLKRALDACPKHGFHTATWAGEDWLWR